VFYLSSEPRLPFHPPSLPPFFSTLAIPSTTALSFLSTARLGYVTCSYPSLPPYLGNPPPSLPPSLPTLAIPSTTALSFLSTARLNNVTCSSPLPSRGRSKARTT